MFWEGGIHINLNPHSNLMKSHSNSKEPVVVTYDEDGAVTIHNCQDSSTVWWISELCQKWIFPTWLMQGLLVEPVREVEQHEGRRERTVAHVDQRSSATMVFMNPSELS